MGWGGGEGFSEVLIFELSSVVYNFSSELMKVRGGTQELEGIFFFFSNSNTLQRLRVRRMAGSTV